MFIKIYFNEKPLFLCDEVDDTLQPYIHHDDSIFIDELNTHTVKSMIHEMQVDKIHAGVFLHPDLEELKKAFFKKFTLVRAAGGLVENENNEWLMIFRRGKWDLPKGKLDEGETLEACAVRELVEETGIRDLQLRAPLMQTWHTYHEGARYILKESHWYYMQAPAAQSFSPQTGEGITEIRWVSDQEAVRLLPASYPSVTDVIRKGLELHL